MRAAAERAGDLVVLYGSTTGRDGIGGASVLASATFTHDDPSKRPSVQVGDPFAEKLLIEATLELIDGGIVESIQDLGAAGITCATSETADRGGMGMALDLDAIPRREPGLEPFEVIISESQERMLAIVRPERWADVRAVCDRWDLPAAVIGRVTDDGDITVRRRAAPELRARAPAPARALTEDAIVHAAARARRRRRRAAPAPGAPRARRPAAGARAWTRAPCCWRSWVAEPRAHARGVYEQYDSHRPGRTPSPVRAAARRSSASRARRKALVATTDGNAGGRRRSIRGSAPR